MHIIRFCTIANTQNIQFFNHLKFYFQAIAHMERYCLLFKEYIENTIGYIYDPIFVFSLIHLLIIADAKSTVVA